MPIPSPSQTPAPAPRVAAPQAAPAIPGQVTTASELGTQYQQLAEQLAALKAQRTVLQSQVRSDVATVRDAASAQLPGVESLIARTTVDLASVRARMATRANAGTTEMPPMSNRRGNSLDADQVTGIFLAFVFAVLMPISLGITRRLWRGRTPTRNTQPLSDMISPRLERLEQAVDAIAIEIERISEGQRFVTKVLVERPATVRPTPAVEAETAAALAEASPFLAIGAGPMEPIRVQERQAVRPSITPY